MAMAMAVCNSWNRLRSQNFFYAIICYYFLLVIPLQATALSFNLTNIGPQLNAEIVVEGDAYVSPEGIQLTSNEINMTQNFSAGRATYKDPLFLWDNTSGKLTDFNTYFSFVIDSIGSYDFADGITFFLVPNGSTPNITVGGSIGLPIGPPTYVAISPSVAVEFDTYQDAWDPVDITPTTHVGIDINSLNSSAYAIWNNDITDGNSAESSISFVVDLKTMLPEWVTIGFSAATGLFFEKNNIKSWTFNSTLQSPNPNPSPSPSPSSNTVTHSPGKKIGKDNKKAQVVGLTVSSFVLVVGLSLLGFFLWKKSSRAKQEDEVAIELSMDNDFEAGTGPKKFSYGELFRATNYFADEQKLGEGGFGGVFKGFLKKLNSYIAVKQISKGSKQGIKKYASEVKIISRLRHRNLVQLLGWCHDKGELLLVYEFMENGSLDYHLYKEKSLLTRAMRYKIAQGLASALLYLHEEWEQCVVHRDVKSSNVMLDSNFNAKLGDFGLARLVDHGKDSQTTILAGTWGYMAPQCLITGKANKESDVYSFVVVALEIACGRKPIDLEVPESQMRMVEWVWDLYGIDRLLEAAVDPKICPNFVKKEIECLMIVGLWCAHLDLNLRPSIRQAIHVLNFEATLPILPAKMPVPTYLAPPVNASSLVSLTNGSTAVSNSNQVQSSSYSYNTNSSKFSSSSASFSLSASLLYT
ncbi:unnamed protein product [Camellia sinensis]